ncbi:MAG: sigma-E processing peptidase SpoIIGA [Monoglobales bacterium]
MPIIYIDVLFLINFILDSILLILAGFISGKNFSSLRIIMGGFLGGLYGISIFFLNFGKVLSLFISLAAATLMITAVYFPLTRKEFFRLVRGFYISAFLLGGALSALFYFSGRPGIMSNGIFYFPLSLTTLLFSAIPLAAVLCYYWVKTKNRLMSHGKYCTLMLSLGEKIIHLDGLIDSGCSLVDPYFNKPSVIISGSAAQRLSAKNFRLIPYSTVTSAGELMQAFTPDRCTITANNKVYRCDCTVAISPAISEGSAIINPGVFGRVEEEL